MVLPWHPRGYAQILGEAPAYTVGTHNSLSSLTNQHFSKGQSAQWCLSLCLDVFSSLPPQCAQTNCNPQQPVPQPQTVDTPSQPFPSSSWNQAAAPCWHHWHTFTRRLALRGTSHSRPWTQQQWWQWRRKHVSGPPAWWQVRPCGHLHNRQASFISGQRAKRWCQTIWGLCRGNWFGLRWSTNHNFVNVPGVTGGFSSMQSPSQKIYLTAILIFFF